MVNFRILTIKLSRSNRHFIIRALLEPLPDFFGVKISTKVKRKQLKVYLNSEMEPDCKKYSKAH